VFLVNIENAELNLQDLTIRVTDIQGKTLYMLNQPSMMGSLLQVSLPDGVSNGLYFVTIDDHQHRSITKRIEVVH
jgi:hypothetical protein